MKILGFIREHQLPADLCSHTDSVKTFEASQVHVKLGVLHVAAGMNANLVCLNVVCRKAALLYVHRVFAYALTLSFRMTLKLHQQFSQHLKTLN